MALEKGRDNSELEKTIEDTRREMHDLKHTVIAEAGKDNLFLKEDKGTIKIENRTISFEGLFLQDRDGNEKKISKINDFYVKRVKGCLEVYSNGEDLPRLKLYNNGNVEGRSDLNNSNFDIKLDGYGTIFDSLRVELTNNYDKYKTPEKKMDFTGKNFSIERGNKKFSVNSGNILFSGLKLFNGQSKKRENIQDITNIYVKRDSENNLTIYSSGEENPKMVLKPNGIVKGVLLNNGDNLNYGAKEDTALWRTIWGELNSKYNTYRHEDVVSTSEPVLLTYKTREEAQYVSGPIVPDGTGNSVVKFDSKEQEPKYISEPIIADGSGNNPVKFRRNSKGEYVSDPIVADGRGNRSANNGTEAGSQGYKYVSEPIVANGRGR